MINFVLKDIEENSNMIDVISERLSETQGLTLTRNEIIADKVKASLVVSNDKAMKFVIEILEEEQAHF